MATRKSKEKSSKPSGVQDAATPFRGDFAERLRWLLDEFDTRKEAGKVAGVSAEYLPSYLKASLKDRAHPKFASIARLAAAKNVSLDWLATGTGSRWTIEAEPDGYAPILLQPEADTPFEETESPAEILFSRSWLNRSTTAAPEELRLVVHRGNFNEPVIRDGDFMLVDIRVKRLAEDGLYVFPRDGKYLARFVENLFDRRVALKARNPDYGVQTLGKDEAGKLPVLGRVIWRGGLM